MKGFISLAIFFIVVGCNQTQDSAEPKKETLQGQNDEKKPSISNEAILKTFVYNPTAGEYLASAKLLDVSDVENLLEGELTIMRNEIFARHGYIFQDKQMKEYFEAQSWYLPVEPDIKKKLTTLEKKNIKLIRRYEKYSQDYGDDFGR